MKNKLCLILLLPAILSASVQAQYYARFKADSVTITPDSAVLTIENFRGIVNWQASSDSAYWHTLTSSGDSLYIRIDSTAAYRALISEGTCDPLYSDTILVGENDIQVDACTFWADSTGGVFYLPNGIKVKIPPGALSDSILFNVEPISADYSYYVMPPAVDEGRIFLGCVNVMPYGTVLNKPIKVQFPVYEFSSDDILVLTGYDPYINMPMNYNGYFLASANDGIIEYNTNRLIPVRAEAIVKEVQSLKSTGETYGNGDLLCKEGISIVKTGESDVESTFIPTKNRVPETTGCQTISQGSETTFVDCGGLKEFDKTKEISSICVPEMTIELEEDMLRVGEPVLAVLKLKVGDFPLSKQSITISSSGSITCNPPGGQTLDDGTLTFYVTAGNADNNGFIKCSTNATYYLQEIEASSIDDYEFTQNYQVTKNCEATMHVICYDECTRPDEFDCSGLPTEKCEEVKKQLIDELEITPEKLSLKKGISYGFAVKSKNYLGDYIPTTPVIIWTSLNPGIASVTENGVVSAISAGKATITADWCNSSEENMVYVGDLCDSADYVIDPSPRTLFLGDDYRIQAGCEFLDPAKNYAPDIHWKSTNTSVAIVDSGGYVTPKRLGQAEIIARWCDTSVTIPVNVMTKIDKYEGMLTTTFEDECKTYSCSITFEFTIYWDSIPFQKERYNSTGGIIGSSIVSQSDVHKPITCGSVWSGKCDGWGESWEYIPTVNAPVEGPVWSNGFSGKLMFEGYFGYWEEHDQYPLPKELRSFGRKCGHNVTQLELLYKIMPTSGARINFSDQDFIDCNLYYKFGYNLVDGNFIEYADHETDQSLAHILLHRIYSNYDEAGTE
jgi:hypothetical protein